MNKNRIYVYFVWVPLEGSELGAALRLVCPGSALSCIWEGLCI